MADTKFDKKIIIKNARLNLAFFFKAGWGACGP